MCIFYLFVFIGCFLNKAQHSNANRFYQFTFDIKCANDLILQVN